MHFFPRRKYQYLRESYRSRVCLDKRQKKFTWRVWKLNKVSNLGAHIRPSRLCWVNFLLAQRICLKPQWDFLQYFSVRKGFLLWFWREHQDGFSSAGESSLTFVKCETYKFQMRCMSPWQHCFSTVSRGLNFPLSFTPKAAISRLLVSLTTSQIQPPRCHNLLIYRLWSLMINYTN